MKKLKGNISIGRPSYGNGDEYVVISIEDDNSHTRFFECRMSLANFTKAITNQAFIPIEFEIRNINQVGKIKESKELIFEIPNKYGYENEKDFAVNQAHKHVDEGWMADTYFGSQTSFFEKDGKRYARTRQCRFVEVKE